jgi:S-adenosylmethionine:tRNA ribosyltransferase-isomerase
MPERFEVNGSVAEAVNRARARGGRVVAVGTTSVRAIESAVRFGSVVPARGWTDLVLSPDRPTAVVDGLVTGWHPPEASHLDLIEAIVGAGLVSNAYRTAHALEYRSHEFGDSCLLLRD